MLSVCKSWGCICKPDLLDIKGTVTVSGKRKTLKATNLSGAKEKSLHLVGKLEPVLLWLLPKFSVECKNGERERQREK
jgi:hypothetical protein